MAANWLTKRKRMYPHFVSAAKYDNISEPLIMSRVTIFPIDIELHAIILYKDYIKMNISLNSQTKNKTSLA